MDSRISDKPLALRGFLPQLKAAAQAARGGVPFLLASGPVPCPPAQPPGLRAQRGLQVGPREVIAWVGENTDTWDVPGARISEGLLICLLGWWVFGVC